MFKKRISSSDAKESNLIFITKSSCFQCALLSLKAAANIQYFLFTKQIKFVFFLSPILKDFLRTNPDFLAEKPEGKDTTLF